MLKYDDANQSSCLAKALFSTASQGICGIENFGSHIKDNAYESKTDQHAGVVFSRRAGGTRFDPACCLRLIGRETTWGWTMMGTTAVR